jgi:hypothetical protein
MTALRVLFSRLSGLFGKSNIENDLDDELGFHLQMEVAENMRKGMSEDEARVTAKRRFGNMAQVKETYRDCGRTCDTAYECCAGARVFRLLRSCA